jgi:DNA invertase Pin-like site-specific DNA recombinase
MPRFKTVTAADTPSVPTFVAYYRVSTGHQERSGLGLDAQRESVARRVETDGGRLIASFQEVESGKRRQRPQLAAALNECRARRAILIIAKLDRLARNTQFLLSIIEGAGDQGVVFCDLPQLPAGPSGRFILTLFAAVAELEAGYISQRTKAAMAQAKLRGVKLGNPNLQPGNAPTATFARAAQVRNANETAASILPYITAAKRAGAVTLREIAAALTARGIRTPWGGEVWHGAQVRRILAREARPQHDAREARPQHDAREARPQHDAREARPHNTRPARARHDAGENSRAAG